MDDRIGPGEIDIFEDAGPRRLRAGTGASSATPSLGDDDDLAVLDVAHEARADNVERAGLRRQNVAAVEFAEDERADAERIARADQLLVGERDSA